MDSDDGAAPAALDQAKAGPQQLLIQDAPEHAADAVMLPAEVDPAVAALPSSLRKAWNIFSDASRTMSFEVGVDKKLYLAAKETDMETRAAFFDVCFVTDGDDTSVFLVCRKGGCKTKTQLQIAGQANFSNAKKHAILCWGILTEEEHRLAEEKDGASSKKRRAAAPAAAVEKPAEPPTVDLALRASIWTQGITIGGLSPELVNNPGFVFIANRLGWGPLTPPSTARDYLRRQAAAVQSNKIKLIALLSSPPDHKITVSGRTESVRGSFTVIHDNCTAKGGKQFMGLGIVVARTQTEMGPGGGVTTVRPHPIILDYSRFSKATGDNAHDAQYYAEAQDRRLRKYGVDPQDCGASAYDTTYVNRTAKNTVVVYEERPDSGSFRTADLSHTDGIPCAIHECNCIGEHTARVSLMAGVIEAANDLSNFFTFDSRSVALEQVQIDKGVARPLKVMHACPTRFLFNILRPARLLELDSALIAVDSRYETTKPRFLASWKKVWDAWRGKLTVAKQIVKLFRPMLDDYARLGCDNEFTLSIRPTLVVKWNAACITALADPDCVIKPVVVKFQEQLWLRMASVAMIDLEATRPAGQKKLGPAAGVALSEYERAEKLELDGATNAAAYFDVATYGSLTSNGGRKDDARAEGWKHVERMLRLVCDAGDAGGAAVEGGGAAAGGAAVEGGGGAAIGAGALPAPSRPLWETAKGKPAIRAALKARPRGPFVSPEEFDRETEELLDDEVARRAALGQHVADAAGAPAARWIDAVRDEYIRQCDEYEAYMKSLKVARDPAVSERLFGNPITLPGKLDRYAFWPQHKAQFHVLYYAAIACLCRPAAGMKLERVNSAVGYINSRLRSCMRTDTLSDFVLAQEWLKETIKVVGAPRGLVDLAAWPLSIGGRESDSEDDSDSSDSD